MVTEYIIAVVYMYYATIYVFLQESPDDGLSMSKHVVNWKIENICLYNGKLFTFILF